jgi:hypothetical protein
MYRLEGHRQGKTCKFSAMNYHLVTVEEEMRVVYKVQVDMGKKERKKCEDVARLWLSVAFLYLTLSFWQTVH